MTPEQIAALRALLADAANWVEAPTRIGVAAINALPELLDTIEQQAAVIARVRHEADNPMVITTPDDEMFVVVDLDDLRAALAGGEQS